MGDASHEAPPRVNFRHLARAAPLVGAAVLLAIGCSVKGPPVPVQDTPDAWRAYADAAEMLRGRLPVSHGSWSLGDTRAEYDAWRVRDSVLVIHETLSMGGFGQRSVQYYFAGRSLRFVREKGTALLGERGGGAVKRPIERELLFSGGGYGIGGFNRVNGEEVPLEEHHFRGALEHAAVLVAELESGAGRRATP